MKNTVCVQEGQNLKHPELMAVTYYPRYSTVYASGSSVSANVVENYLQPLAKQGSGNIVFIVPFFVLEDILSRMKF